MSFGGDLQGFSRKTGITLDKIVRKVVIDMTREIVKLTPVDTGMAKNNWFWGLTRASNIDNSLNQTNYRIAKGLQFSPSLKAKQKAIKAFAKESTGKASLERAMSFAGTIKGGGVFYLVNNLPYIMALEYGHSQAQAPHGMARITVDRWQSIVNAAVKASL